MARGTRLLERPPEEIAVLLGHSVQREIARLIGELVGELRTLDGPGDYYEFQRELAGHVYDAQRRQAESSRNLKRERSGRAVVEPDAPTWTLSLALWDRTVRQLRAVGDALAWRLFGFDRRYILALSRNQAAGPVVGKEGLGWELGAVKDAWERDGTFALLHDLTNSIRIADITVFGPTRPTLVEIKKSNSGGSRRREQMRRAERAVAVINEGAPLPGREEVDLAVSDQQFKTQLSALRRQVELAQTDSIASRSIGHQQVVTALAVTARAELPIEELIARSDTLKSRAMAKAGLEGIEHHLRGVRADTIGRDAYLAPFTIYPFSPKLVAALTTDLICFEHVVGWDRIERAFETHRFDVELLLASASGEVPDDVAVLHDLTADRRVTVHKGGLDQLLHELVDVERYVAGIAAQVRRSDNEGTTHAVLTFANERATWR